MIAWFWNLDITLGAWSHSALQPADQNSPRWQEKLIKNYAAGTKLRASCSSSGSLKRKTVIMFLYFFLKHKMAFISQHPPFYDSLKKWQKLSTPTQLCESMCGMMDSPVTADRGVNTQNILHKEVQSACAWAVYHCVYSNRLVGLGTARLMNSVLHFQDHFSLPLLLTSESASCVF